MKNMRNMNRQGGAVAVIVGISILLLVGFLAMVIDLGHLYIAKTELQNGADAAALAGAKELNGTAGGVASAVAMAQNLAGRNYYDLANKKIYDTTDSETQNDVIDIWVGSSPNDADMVLASTVTDNATAANKTFLKVHTHNRDMVAYFAPIWNIFHVSTYGMAVAGRYTVKITPIAMCAIDVRQCPCLSGETGCGQGSQLCGYEPGKSYHIAGVNPIGPGTPLWIDPLATSASTCDTTNTRDNRPFVCQGEASVSTIPGDYVYTNTGLAAGPLYNALDSRFGDYASNAKCARATAPPDRNVQEYAYQLFNDVTVTGQNPYRNQSKIPDWLTPSPNPGGTYPQTSVCSLSPASPDQYGGKIYSCPWTPNGVYWAVSRPALGVPTPTTNSNYPSTGSPYSQTSGSYFKDGGSGQLAGRRLLNLIIVQCESAGGVCRPARNRMVGQFLQQTRASVSNNVNVEFNRAVSQDEILGEIKLYR